VHDGFTLRDLVFYDDKHNEANGEDNRDGTSDNRSWNCGAEGPTSDPDITELRTRQSRAMLTTLMLSFGVPLLLGGDEMGRTQGGNNNAYCQDNEMAGRANTQTLIGAICFLIGAVLLLPERTEETRTEAMASSN
jgi:glycogen operon protein